MSAFDPKDIAKCRFDHFQPANWGRYDASSGT